MLKLPVPGKLAGSYDWKSVEEAVKALWDAEEVYELVREKSKASEKKFAFVDGPPYPSGEVPHVGTAWNKTLKDIVLRYKRARGYDVDDRPGYDCHGLPIEVMVERRLGVKNKREIEAKIGIEKFVEECRRAALSNAESMTKWFRELGVFMDWGNPYYTLTNDYVEAAWQLIKRAHELGLLDRDFRVVYWCPRCQTTLAEYEVEYKDIESPSIVVKMGLEGEPSTSLLVWTTTPWTLPANTFIMVHPREKYVKVRVGDEHWIVAKNRLSHVLELAGAKGYEVVAEFEGRELVGKRYRHPLEDVVPLQRELARYHLVLPSEEFVNVHEGTGLVHAAPGHGFEDFEVAARNGISLVASPVDDEGRFTQEAGKYAGMPVREANEAIIRDLELRGALVHAGKIVHKYPVCWRCKTPVVMRATRQWVIRVSKLKDKLVEEAKKVKWVPGWGLDRMLSILNNVQDWVISRQRYWGTPLPIWVCERGHWVVVGSREELRELGGEVPEDLHRPWIDRVVLRCPVCGSQMKRVPDVADVWLDSGIAFFAAQAKGGADKPRQVDFIVEGHDQIRGWFFSLLRSGVIAFGAAPYRAVLIHGFMLDEKGREMHKSLGNYVGLDEALARVGRDALRLWLASNVVWEDARFSWKSLEETARDIAVAWNVASFASTYMSLDGFDPKAAPLRELMDALRPEDRWLLSRLNSMLKKVTESLEEYRIHEAARELRKFIVEDVSHWYIRLVRPRVWVEENTRDKLAAYAVLYHALRSWLVAASPFIPFVTEYIYQKVLRPVELAPSVHLLEWPEVDEGLIDPELEKEMEVVRAISNASYSARMRAGLKLRQPVRRVVVFSDDPAVAKVVEKHADIIKLACNAKEVAWMPHASAREITEYTLEPVYKRLGPKFRDRAKKVIERAKANEREVAEALMSRGYYDLEVDGELVRIERGDFEVRATFVKGFSAASTDFGAVAVDTRLTEEEVADGLARDIVRRVQVMRKMMGLELDAKVETFIKPPPEKKSLVEARREYIMRETGSARLEVVDELPPIEGFVREWDIDDETYVVLVRKVG